MTHTVASDDEAEMENVVREALGQSNHAIVTDELKRLHSLPRQQLAKAAEHNEFQDLKCQLEAAKKFGGLPPALALGSCGGLSAGRTMTHTVAQAQP